MIAKQADKINDLHSSLGGLAKKSLQVAQEIGERLSRIKAELKHGEWLPWCRENLAFGINTAGNYMRLHRERDKFTSIGNLDLTEAYRLLSAPADEDDEPEPELGFDERAHFSGEERQDDEEDEPIHVEVIDETEETPVDNKESLADKPPSEEDADKQDYRPNNAMKYATMAIAQLERIALEDEQRSDAFKKVMNYCSKKIKQQRK